MAAPATSVASALAAYGVWRFCDEASSPPELLWAWQYLQILRSKLTPLAMVPRWPRPRLRLPSHGPGAYWCPLRPRWQLAEVMTVNERSAA